MPRPVVAAARSAGTPPFKEPQPIHRQILPAIGSVTLGSPPTHPLLSHLPFPTPDHFLFPPPPPIIITSFHTPEEGQHDQEDHPEDPSLRPEVAPGGRYPRSTGSAARTRSPTPRIRTQYSQGKRCRIDNGSGAEGTRTPDPPPCHGGALPAAPQPRADRLSKDNGPSSPARNPSRHVSPLRSRPASATSQRCARPRPSPGRCHAASTTTRWTARRCW